MLFMVIEHYVNGAAPVYERFRARGRQAPEGLTYIDSWVEAGLCRCFQLMECDDLALLQEWVANWEDIVRFEVVPVTPSAVAASAVHESTTTR
jgi:Protein of unknown function (DUF3303)